MQSPLIVIMRGEFYLFQYRDLDIVGICGLTQEKLSTVLREDVVNRK